MRICLLALIVLVMACSGVSAPLAGAAEPAPLWYNETPEDWPLETPPLYTLLALEWMAYGHSYRITAGQAYQAYREGEYALAQRRFNQLADYFDEALLRTGPSGPEGELGYEYRMSAVFARVNAALAQRAAGDDAGAVETLRPLVLEFVPLATDLCEEKVSAGLAAGETVFARAAAEDLARQFETQRWTQEHDERLAAMFAAIEAAEANSLKEWRKRS
ncbi:hypothetical protein X907_2227 [Glycocaulis alkaliphilus]|uniref:Uncharacterized protein n=1 Tax=Glycocaulis alkaliphilus TaxID=1434191 RepID=A0A3T0EBP1_9PROT|nr:hypothetical protein [Glycocaulis alkaliphilus]AZU04742.1 hypothetical protein X907_2227 [Glycocaulis alkaliphilus]GGB68015.1 hypothetical protein GCM10007417_04840 [Glycocaulis alkaliphilus]